MVWIKCCDKFCHRVRAEVRVWFFRPYGVCFHSCHTKERARARKPKHISNAKQYELFLCNSPSAANALCVVHLQPICFFFFIRNGTKRITIGKSATQLPQGEERNLRVHTYFGIRAKVLENNFFFFCSANQVSVELTAENAILYVLQSLMRRSLIRSQYAATHEA